MRKIAYAGATFYTGDKIPAALLEYAVALARVGSAATASFPACTSAGTLARLDVVFGVASQVVSEPIELYGAFRSSVMWASVCAHRRTRAAVSRIKSRSSFAHPLM